MLIGADISIPLLSRRCSRFCVFAGRRMDGSNLLGYHAQASRYVTYGCLSRTRSSTIPQTTWNTSPTNPTSPLDPPNPPRSSPTPSPTAHSRPPASPRSAHELRSPDPNPRLHPSREAESSANRARARHRPIRRREHRRLRTRRWRTLCRN